MSKNAAKGMKVGDKKVNPSDHLDETLSVINNDPKHDDGIPPTIAIPKIKGQG